MVGISPGGGEGVSQSAVKVPSRLPFPITPISTNAVAGPSGTSSTLPPATPLKTHDKPDVANEDVVMGVEGESELTDLDDDEKVEDPKGKGKRKAKAGVRKSKRTVGK